MYEWIQTYPCAMTQTLTKTGDLFQQMRILNKAEFNGVIAFIHL
jgi:hypothetical protein